MTKRGDPAFGARGKVGVELQSVRRVLALVPNWLGDAAMCTPALRALHRRFPAAALTVAGRESVCRLLEGLPWIAGFAPLPARPEARAMLRLGQMLRRLRPDLCVAFPHSFRAALLARFSGASQRLGYRRDRRSWLLTDLVEPHLENGRVAPIYMAREYLELLAPLGCEDDGRGLELFADPAEVQTFLDKVRAAGGEARPLVGLAPGAAYGPSKRWPAERFAQVADNLAARAGAQCVLLTGPGEEDTRTAFLQAVRTPVVECYDDAPSIARMKAAISQMDVLVGNDSGPRHVAVAFQRPVVCIMGPTSPAYTESPWEIGEVIRVDVDCGPCQKPICETDHRCMTLISSERVTEAALRWLQRGT